MREGTILPADVTEAVVERLKEAFPGETVYTDLTPRDFTRPCNMVELVNLGLDPLTFGLSGVDLLYKVKITTFSTVDEVHASHLPVLGLRRRIRPSEGQGPQGAEHGGGHLVLRLCRGDPYPGADPGPG